MAEKTELLEEDEKVVEIELERLRGFENHPFKVRADSQMIELQESIKKYGILNPLIVRPKKDGCYEIISGHRRKFAAEKIGYRRLGVTFVAANAITSVTQQLSTVMIQGVCQAGAIVTGQTLGEGKQEQAQSQAYRFLGLGLGLGMLSAFFIMAVSPAIIGSYKVSEETAEVAAQLMHAISLILIFQATNSIMTKGVLRGGGDTKMLMLADNLFLWVVSIPLGMLAGFVFHFPAFWIYVCLKADQILKAVWCVFRLRSGKWMKKITVGKVSGQEDRA